MDLYTEIDLYNITNIYQLVTFPKNSEYNTNRKLKEIPYYFIFNEEFIGVKPIIIVKDKFDLIKTYSFNYNDAKDKGVNVILTEEINLFENFTYVYMSDDYNKCMSEFLNKKKKYLKSRQLIILDEIKKLEIEKSVKSYEERERLMQELEKRINEMLDIYDEQIERMNAKVNRINNQISNIDELSSTLK